jgi:hypothetical protein
LALGALLGAGLAGPAVADNDVGCGVGTRLMEGRSGLAYHVLASCTNAYTLQSVSLTFNLFGCDSNSKVTADAELRRFAAANIDQLARDAARGEGETISAFAHLLGVPAAQQGAFGVFAQAHFVELFPSDGVTSNQMIDALYDLLEQHRVEG